MAKLGARKSAIEAQLAEASIYSEANRDALKALLLDQAYVGKELEELEAEWLEKQEALEQVAAGSGAP
jgi:ATP-binding cassette subfamily F protein 3